MTRIPIQRKREFKRNGFIVLENELDGELVEECRDHILNRIPEDPERIEEEMDRRYVKEAWPIVDRPELFERVNDRLFAYAEELVGTDVLEDPGEKMQIALRYPEGRPQDPSAPQKSDVGCHIDGYGPEYEPGDDVKHFMLFAVVYFDRVEPTGGGFTVWPGSHWNVAEYFKENDISGGFGGIPALDSDGGWLEDEKRHEQFDPFEIAGPAGTVVLAHGKLEHIVSPNLTPNLRIAGIKRFLHEEREEIKRDAAQNPWKYWERMRDVDVNFHEYDVRLP